MATAPEPPTTQKGPERNEYPKFEDSAYAVPGTQRRQRWWNSNGIWLDQGQTAQVVGFAWTHWLADRGVEVNDGELGADYAAELQREAQRLGGGEVDPHSGAKIEAAAWVLQSRGLIAQCYSFQSMDSVVSALLERGPVLAGIAWHSEMYRPVDIDGWSVCRYSGGESSRPVANYLSLLNGVALDLRIGGVTGFVRLKNTWGRRWADEGQTLISIADLSAVVDLGSSLLPIPVPSVLRPGNAADVAVEEPPYQPHQIRFEQSSITGDVATPRDSLGTAPYAEAIARGIQHRETKAPLTIGIKAPWGAGKTSLMRMIRDRLEWPDLDGSPDKLRPVHLTTETARRVAATARRSAVTGPEALGKVTNREVLRKLRDSDEEPAAGELKANPDKAGAGAPPPGQDRWRPTVWFNPWMYQTGEQVWAGLANEIIGQVTERMTRGEREHFWLHLNRARIDEQAVRRKIYGLVLSRAVPYALFGLVMLAGGIALLATGRTGWVGVSVALAGPATLLGGAVAGWQALGSRVGTSLTSLVKPATGARQFASGQLADSYEELVISPDYRAQAGYLYLVHTDIRRVLDLVATPSRPLVIFVDDLDRCSPGTVVQVIEAINIFVAGAYPNCIFVIAMEPEMVAAHIEAAYADLARALDDTASTVTPALSLGWRFLEKIVQLPLALPAMEPAVSVHFIESLFPAGTVGDRDGTGPAAADAPSARDAPAAGPGDDGGDERDGSDPAVREALRTASLSEAVNIAGGVRPDTAAGREVRRVIDRRLSASDPEVREVIEYASRALNLNPREIKRFVNLFRFYTMIYAERKLANLPAPGSLDEVAKLAVLGIRWPDLLGVLAMPVWRDWSHARGHITVSEPLEKPPFRTVFELLEKPPFRDDEAGEGMTREAVLEKKLRETLMAAGLSESTIGCVLAPELRNFLAAKPIVGAGMHGYL